MSMRLTKAEMHEEARIAFAAQPPRSEEIKQAYDIVAIKFEELAHSMIAMLPEGRSLELVIEQLTATKREAIAAIACHQDEYLCQLGDDA